MTSILAPIAKRYGIKALEGAGFGTGYELYRELKKGFEGNLKNMAKQNPNQPSTLPAQPVNWNWVRQEHGKPDQAVIDQHERILAQLDSVPPEKGGRGKR